MNKVPQQILLRELVDSYSKEEEVDKIYSFGSISTSSFDHYSDIDLTILTYDIKRTTERFIDVINKTKKVNSIFTIFESDHSAAYTIFFKNLVPYHKIDIGFCPTNKPQLFDPCRLEFESKTKNILIDSKVIPRRESDFDHQVLDCFIGSIRYLKHLFRNEPWVAYKFYRSFIEQFLYIKVELDSNTFDFNNYKEVSNKLGNNFLDIIFVPSQKDMNNAYYRYLGEYYNHSKNKISAETKEFIESILTFWNKELQTLNK